MDSNEEFLKSDFEQYHEWMRHYDKSFSSMINFLYSGYAAVITASYVIVSKYPKAYDAKLGATLLLSFAALLTPVFIYWLMKKRKYFVDTARWVNRIRSAFLKQAPLGIDKPAAKWETPEYPPYFNSTSTQIIFLYFTAFCGAALNSISAVSAVITGGFIKSFADVPIWIYLICLFVFSAIYIVWIRCYLMGLEKAHE
ncbi:hypothetical protein LCGC14_1590970 [marine sediment metagenome]|uniref:MotA/TolQ/ExbB proton channel domain-containing protein n=1 Tax=marine sediment metagenome TaxID=412755 RepID=A0A0F9IDX6_9ZZZZ